MQIKRSATAHWAGSGKDGKGTLSSASGVLNEAQYGFKSRFEDGIGTNPEELIAAAHSGCFSMKLAFNLQAANFIADSIDTKAIVVLENGAIPEIQLETTVKAVGLTVEKLNELVADAKLNCPISKLFNASISVKATLI
ncbi:MAG: OsmC family peroxiredoxin [Bacteroidota bacterium]